MHAKPSTASSAMTVNQLRIAVLQRERSLPCIILAALESKLFAAGQDHFGQTHCWCAVLRRIACDSDLVARFHYALGPAAPRQSGYAHRFENPVLHLARGVLHIKEDLRMRILVAKFGYGSLQGRHLVRVIARRTMVCEREAGTYQNKGSQSEACRDFDIHGREPPIGRDYSIGALVLSMPIEGLGVDQVRSPAYGLSADTGPKSVASVQNVLFMRLEVRKREIFGFVTCVRRAFDRQCIFSARPDADYSPGTGAH